jgi:DNA polymerase elongation subunit (family B)
MKFYTNITIYGNNALVRGVHNGQRFQTKENFKPKLFVPKKKPGEATYHNMYGEPLDVMEFGDLNDAREFIKNYEGVSNMKIHGNTNWTYQYITENYSGQIEFDMAQIAIWGIDIETTSEQGFPNVDDPQEEILLITIQDLATRTMHTWGRKPYHAVEGEDKTIYHHCASESTLLKEFLNYWNQNCPDVVTGWNSNLFDLPYIINRTERVLGPDSSKLLSPWRQIKRRDITYGEKTLTTFDIVGVAHLDYLDLYKKFTYGAQESYKLDYICKVELGVGKLENPFDTFKEFYTNDWNRFTQYNIVDTERVLQLEDKMKLIELAVTMAFDAKCLFGDVYSAVRTWDCVLYNHLWDQNIVVHPRNSTRPDRSIEGAFVQDPVPGKYDWVVSLDATSLYPSIIMQYNMSPETLVEPELDTHLTTTVSALLDKKENLSELKTDNHCMTANGYYFNRNKKGLFPEIVQKLFNDRVLYKNKEKAAKQEYEQTHKASLLNDISRYYNFQMARKIQLNSLFGAWANYYFRYFDDRIAEGITITGQLIIQQVGRAINEYLNRVVGTKDFVYSFYSDTDSCYITLDPLVKKFYANKSKSEIVDILDKICKEKLTDVINQACMNLADYTNAFEPKVFFKREAIADSGIWVAKKRYALNVYDNEEVRYAEPKLKVMGLEIVRSSTPEVIRNTLKEAVRVAITADEAALQKFINTAREQFDQFSPEDIAFPRGVNGMKKYQSSSNIYASGCPMHVRGSLLYNHHLQKLKLTNKYELIGEGDKIKFLYLKTPNPFKENCVAFIGKLPAEFQLTNYVDYDTMWDKAFIEPLNGIIEGLGWSTSPQATLAGLFS